MKIKALRKLLGLSRGQFARALGVNLRSIARWERGIAEPMGLTAEVIAGIVDAIEAGAEPRRVGLALTNGVRRLICRELMQQRDLALEGHA